MKNKVLQQLNILEESRRSLMSLCEQVPEESLQRQPQPGKWSVMQIITHLITSEQLSLNYIRKKSQGIKDLPNTGIGADARMFLLKISQRIPLKYKAPKVVVQHTPETLSFEKSRQAWENLRKELHSFIINMESQDLKKAIYKHPVGGRLNILQALIFFQEHFNHHLPQINRLIK